MNYPVWLLDAFGGGTLIAIVAVAHVYISHLAVGGGLFLVLTEIKGLREGSTPILDYVHKHTRFFLLLTMVFGGMSGVGIWFTIALLSPSGTSSLIHTFVFGWAIEWVFFVGEIVALVLYYYNFNKISSRSHLILGWIYFGCAWLSLFIINGVIDFMLTPGSWIENGNFWSGFFNETFWPALFFRTFLCLMIAGLFGFLTSVNIKNDDLRHNMVRYCGIWLVVPLLLLLASAYWYKIALPPAQQEMVFVTAPGYKPMLTWFAYLSPLLFAGGLIMAIVRPQSVVRPVAWLLVVCGFLYMGCFEFIREGGRRPYIIWDHMYSTSILKSELSDYQKNGFLKSARWVKNKELTLDNRMAAGKEMYTLLCLPCHSEGGVLNDILPQAEKYTVEGMDSFLAGVGDANKYMPPFAGNEEERRVLAEYLTTTLTPDRSRIIGEIKKEKVAHGPFDQNKDEYVLLASTDRGMSLSSQPELSGLDFSYGPPTLRAQLIYREESPSVISEGVKLRYAVSTGSGVIKGLMTEGDGYFQAELGKLTPPSDLFRPYNLADIEAVIDSKVVATTRVRVGVSNGFGCRHCHGGPWRSEDSGLSRQTAQNILRIHDRRSGTSLLDTFNNSKIVVCSSCHADSSRKEAGRPEQLGLSSAMHGFHAAMLGETTTSSCSLCHGVGQESHTRSFDGLHNHLAGLDCSSCHGTLAEHGASLLKAEGKSGGELLLAQLSAKVESGLGDVKPRRAWEMEPDCLTCHVEFGEPETDSAFNSWTESRDKLFAHRKGEAAVLLCTSCHGAPHSLYPAASAHSDQVGVLAPLQYQASSYPIGADKRCDVCHTEEMEDEIHHPGSLGEFRNRVE
ncbi:MAG: hypothetical protein ABFS19_11075 [Thermodesulfobacteriota bacterium]